MSQEDRDLGEQALSKVAEAGISSQLDEVVDVDVDIATDPFKLAQGELDSVAVNGRGMVMEKDLRMEEMHLQTGHVGVNPLSTVFGNVELTHPTDATAQVVLTEGDINRAFNSDYLQQKLQELEVSIDEKPTKIYVRQIEFSLPGDDKIFLQASVELEQSGETKQVAFTTTPRVSSGAAAPAKRDRHQVLLENIEYHEGEGLSPELTEKLLEQARELLDLRNFELEGMSLRLRKLEVASEQITLLGDAHIEQFPSE
ncbi:DUF2993 domain-containing protein [Pleurocapsales cyanobacterium LEGE 06147]|nr:DUF2993 domain-containing protein [Pleurocapsales cyanobacterium LEGE 06147]